MARTIISLEKGAELQRLLQEHVSAVLNGAAILNKFGMDSPEFREADAATGKLSRQIREIQGLSGKHWMA